MERMIMQAVSFSSDVLASADVHLAVLDKFIAVVRRRLGDTANPFLRESLSDLLSDLAEQRDGHRLLAAAPLAQAA